MIDVIGVITVLGKIDYLPVSNGLNMKKDEYLLYEGDSGLHIGRIVTDLMSMKKENLSMPMKKIVRIMTKNDLHKMELNQKESQAAFHKCESLIQKHKLNMHLICCDYTFDRKQLIFQFQADERVDFRNLVKELASIYRTRIELRQIGVRDKAKIIGGLGPCGRLLCCSQFLYNFDKISINMAKNQDISLNPNKINGSCGRLLCCLTYEDQMYHEARKHVPELGTIVTTEQGKGRVIQVNILTGKYRVSLNDGGILDINGKEETV